MKSILFFELCLLFLFTPHSRAQCTLTPNVGFGIPAVIGAGGVLFEQWRAARKLCLDCTNQKALVIA
jgi:hypothetical protein